jgi:hypothetical protein
MDMAIFMLQLLYSQGKRPQYPFDRGWVHPRADLDGVAKRRISAPARHQTLVILSTALSLYWLIYTS